MSDARSIREDRLKIGPSKTAGTLQGMIHAQVHPHGEQRRAPADLGNPFPANAVNEPLQHRNGARAQDAILQTHAPRNVAQHPRNRPANLSPRDGMHGIDQNSYQRVSPILLKQHTDGHPSGCPPAAGCPRLLSANAFWSNKLHGHRRVMRAVNLSNHLKRHQERTRPLTHFHSQETSLSVCRNFQGQHL